MSLAAPVRFELDASREATSPPEVRGLRRDEVRLLVAAPDGLAGSQFFNLPDYLRDGDLLVVNTSPTMPAAIAGKFAGRPAMVHFSQRHEGGTWTVELRRPDRSGPMLNATAGDVVEVPAGLLTLVNPAEPGRGNGVRLWRAEVGVVGGVRRLMRRHGSPIRYNHVGRDWPLRSYQTIFADLCRWPGSAEMASAARPFSGELVRRLDSNGVRVATIALDAGVSSLDVGETPPAEPFSVSGATARAVNAAHDNGGRVIAVGTTVTRALESSVGHDGRVIGRSGWTSLVLGSDRPAQVVDGLITGWHPPGASHLKLLEAVVGTERVRTAYGRALEDGYLWHEFGDSCLFIR